jgi:hypothetical protein
MALSGGAWSGTPPRLLKGHVMIELKTTAQEAVGTTIARGPRVWHPPLAANEQSTRNENRRGYGNDALMEITKRFPQELGNLAGEREIPTFPQPIIFVSDEKRRQKNERYEVNPSHTQNS